MIVMQDAMSLKIMVYVDDMKLHLWGVAKDFQQRVKDRTQVLKAEMRSVKFEFSVTDGGKEGKSKLEVSNPCLRQEEVVF